MIPIEELIAHPAPSAGRIVGGIYPYNSGGNPIPEKIMKNAQERGIWVHDSIESEIKTGSYEGNWEWEGYMDAFHKFNEEHNPSYMASELCIVSSDERAKGIVDAVAAIDGEIAIIDFKTGVGTDHARFELQIAIYAHILNDLGTFGKIDRLHIVKLGKDGSYKLLYYEYDKEVVESVINVYHYLVSKGAIKAKQ